LDDQAARSKLRSAIVRAIRSSPRSRQQIAEAMSQILGQPISVHLINSWTAETKKRVRFPAAWIPAFCEAAMDDAPRLALLSAEHRARLRIKEELAELRSMIATLLAAEEQRERSKGRIAHASKVNGRGASK